MLLILADGDLNASTRMSVATRNLTIPWTAMSGRLKLQYIVVAIRDVP